MIVIKGRSSCDWTTNAIMLCDIHRIDHQFIDLNNKENSGIVTELKEAGIETPAIYKNQKYIGGYQAFQQWLITQQEEEIKWQVM